VLEDGAVRSPALEAAMRQLGNAVVALQFEDMATQLIQHTHRRVRSCVDQLARQTFADDEDGPAEVELPPLHPNPVTQDEMDAGSVELF
jgi:3-phosphoglycerate kinase